MCSRRSAIPKRKLLPEDATSASSLLETMLKFAKAFQAFTISEMSIHPIEPRRLRHESAELGLLYSALSVAIAKHCPVDVHRGSRRTIVSAAPSEIAGPRYDRMRAACSNLTGIIPKTKVRWTEAIRLRLEFPLKITCGS